MTQMYCFAYEACPGLCLICRRDTKVNQERFIEQGKMAGKVVGRVFRKLRSSMLNSPFEMFSINKGFDQINKYSSHPERVTTTIPLILSHAGLFTK